MRRSTFALTVLMLGASSQAAWALNTDDTMASWATASAAERSGVVDQIMSKQMQPGHLSRSELTACLSQAAGVGGHEHLPIGEIAEACSHPAGADDPGKKDIGI